ncbi:M56 family metallopeptidase [Pseudomarimonas arenosa]|uniref:Protein TonB n=1 Tax=Pseudomarimonas arenosa TaxID=2774145 RepID=A0AAW3ZDC0_9GAMM|nr:M56 family metallopeptidase [Pseudomarimonas arenosa]MBD8524223.1 TonB family protein [Pseudomarimonas arenosa]
MLELALERWPWVEHVGWALLHSVWQICLIGLLYAVGHWALSRAKPVFRIWLGESALLACLLLPILTVLASESPAQAVVGLAGEGTQQVMRVFQVSAELDWLTQGLAAIALVWMIAVVVLGARAAWKWRYLQQVVSRAGAVPSAWQRRWADILEQAGIGRPVRWLESAEVAGPLLIGWLKPVILFPVGMAARLPAAQVELLLEHELAHIRRADFLFNALQLVVETLLFFHPVVHWMARSIRHDRELACDERVACRHTDRLTYARALLSAAELHREHSLGLAASGGHLLDRIRRLVGEPGIQDPRDSLLRALPMTLALLAVLAALRMAPIAPLWEKLPVADLVVEAFRPAEVAPIDLSVRDLAGVEAPGLAMIANPVSAPVLPAQMPIANLPLTSAPIEVAPASESTAVAEPIEALELRPLMRSKVIAALPESPVDWLRPLNAPPPTYPIAARRSGTEGFAELSFSVDSAGRVQDIRVESSSPNDSFVRAAERALTQWRFQPGNPSSERRVQRFDFTLTAGNSVADSHRQCDISTGTRLCRR